MAGDLQGVSSDYLVRTRAGEVEAFGEFYDQTGSDLLSWFRCRTASNEIAAELTAETFAEALRSLHSYDPARGAPVQWLYGIARHMLHRWWRSERVSRDARSALRVFVDLPSEDDTDLAVFRVDMESRFGHLSDALRGLSDPLREAVYARIVLQLSYAEVAEKLDCTPGAARVRVSRGLSQMHSHLQAAGVDGV